MKTELLAGAVRATLGGWLIWAELTVTLTMAESSDGAFRLSIARAVNL